MTKIRLSLCAFFCLAGLLVACGEVTPTSGVVSPPVNVGPTGIPTFTFDPKTPVPTGTPAPTVIELPPTATVAPTPSVTAASIRQPTPAPSPTLAPTATPRPTATLATGAFREITQEQARNLGGYRAMFPTYLPSGFKLSRTTVGETTNPRLITVLSEYNAAQGRYFYINALASPGTSSLPPTLPPTTPDLLTPRPSVQIQTGIFRQETVTIRGQPALLSYSDQQASLSWAEGVTRYSINGALSRADILKVAESLG